MVKRLHIGFLTPEYVSGSNIDGGLANYIRHVGLALTERGHQVSVFVLRDYDGFFRDNGINVYEVKRADPGWLRRFPFKIVYPMVKQVLSSRRLASSVWEVHRDTPFDILQASSYSVPGYSLCHNGIVPLVCRISSYTPLLRLAYGRKRRFSEYLSDWLETRQVQDADASFAPSYFMANAFPHGKGYQPQLIRTPIVDFSDMPVDPSYYQENLTGKKYLLFFGTLSRIKGLDLLADVIPQVLNRYEDLYFVFIGRDDGLPNGEKMFAYLSTRCGQFGYRLGYHPALPKMVLYPVIANALGVLMPSRVDNYPNSCLEAQSLGVPVVGTYGSSLDEMIEDNKTGFLAKNGDAVSLYDAIERLLMLTPAQRDKMRQQILEYVRTVSSEDRIGQLLAFYDMTIRNFNR